MYTPNELVERHHLLDEWWK